MDTQRKKIGALLVEQGYVTGEQVEKALEAQKTSHKRLGDVLIDLGFLTDHRFHEFLGTLEGMASVELDRYEISADIIKLIPKELARRYEAVPLGKMRNLLTVGMVCPLDETALATLDSTTGLKIKAVLCSRKAIYSALQRYYPRESRTNEQSAGSLPPVEPTELLNARELMERVQELPTLPDIIQTVSAIVNDPKSSATDLAKLISTDAALSAKILKLANSPAYGFTRKVIDIRHAVALLGFRETQALALSISAFSYVRNGGSFDYRSHWNHSYACATLGKIIAANLSHEQQESAFVAGLLHDIGKAAFATNIFSNYRLRGNSGKLLTSELDEEHLGISHAEFGFLLAEHWLLPSVLTHAIRYHHIPEHEQPPGGLAAVVYLANLFCDANRPAPAQNDQVVTDVLDLLRIPPTLFSQVLEIYRDIASEISIF